MADTMMETIMNQTISRFIGAAALWILVFGGAEAFAQEFSLPVRHNHVIGSCTGELIITRDGVEYRATNKDHARKWTYTDIRMITLVSPREVKVLTYEQSGKLKLGQDRTFDFRVLKGEVPPALSDFLLGHVTRPLATSFLTSEESAQFAIPVRHRHRVGGEQGTLKIYAGGVSYESEKSESSRRWRWTDIQSISRPGPYKFSITTYEPKFGGPTKTFNFDLKERMDDSVYDYLWARIYKPALPASPESRVKTESSRSTDLKGSAEH
jgi:hypothetical protein